MKCAANAALKIMVAAMDVKVAAEMDAAGKSVASVVEMAAAVMTAALMDVAGAVATQIIVVYSTAIGKHKTIGAASAAVTASWLVVEQVALWKRVVEAESLQSRGNIQGNLCARVRPKLDA